MCAVQYSVQVDGTEFGSESPTGAFWKASLLVVIFRPFFPNNERTLERPQRPVMASASSDAPIHTYVFFATYLSTVYSAQDKIHVQVNQPAYFCTSDESGLD